MPTPQPAARPRVWVVDDSPLEAEVARRSLELGHDVTLFADGSTVLESLSTAAAPDLLILDWHMPGVTGIDVCRFLRSNPATEALPALILTTRSHTTDLVEALVAGADDFLSKPYDPTALVARVTALVRTKRLRDRVDQAERTVRMLLRSLPDALVTVDAAGSLRFVNDEAQRMLGVDGAAVLGRSVREVLPGLSLDDIAKSSTPDLHPLPDLKIGDRSFAPIVRRLATDSATDLTISLRDVTDRRHAETRRMDFYSIIAHDLRAPLSVVQLKTELILRGKRGDISAETRADLDTNRRRITELIAMVDDFLDLARLEAGMRIEAAPIDLRAIAQEILEDFQLVADQRSVHLHLDADCDPMASGDRRRLVQVFNNLVSNAIKFSREGGDVRVQIAETGTHVEVLVHDSGVGIRPASLATLFQRYSRAVDHEHKVAGTGLGLMIVREIVEAHGGTVVARSEQGVGSTFGFVLPKGAPAA